MKKSTYKAISQRNQLTNINCCAAGLKVSKEGLINVFEILE